MPESSYAFRPTPDLRTFGQQINHATGAHYSFCNQAGVPPGVQKQAAPSLATITAKPAIVAALKESIAYCDRVLAAASEEWLREIAPGLGGSSSGLIHGMRAHCVHLQRRAQRRRLRDDYDVYAHAGRRAAVDRPASAGPQKVGPPSPRLRRVSPKPRAKQASDGGPADPAARFTHRAETGGAIRQS